MADTGSKATKLPRGRIASGIDSFTPLFARQKGRPHGGPAIGDVRLHGEAGQDHLTPTTTPAPRARRLVAEDLPLRRESQPGTAPTNGPSVNPIGSHGAPGGASLSERILRTASAGRALPSAIRRQFEPHFGPLDDVTIHTDDRSAQQSQGLRADAFTIGSHIFFGPGRFEPATREGRALLAHELTHVVQERRGRTSPVGQLESTARQVEQQFRGTAAERGGAGISVEVYERTYHSANHYPLSRVDQQRLDQIAIMALQRANELLADHPVLAHADVHLDTLDIRVHLNLTNPSNAALADVWGHGIASAVEQSLQRAARPTTGAGQGRPPLHRSTPRLEAVQETTTEETKPAPPPRRVVPPPAPPAPRPAKPRLIGKATIRNSE